MSTISNERLESLQRQFKEDGFNDISDSEIMQLVEENLALRKERELAEPVACPKCGSTGLADSGGVQPWGEPIFIECDCRYTSTTHETDTTSQQFESLAGKAVVPEGWKLVPIEPTKEMIAKMRYHNGGYDKHIKNGYAAMLSVAPEPCK
ncbi:hypothetical protein ACT6F8_002685 [Cronobacter dublinensis]